VPQVRWRRRGELGQVPDLQLAALKMSSEISMKYSNHIDVRFF
jgi:hypothetical protein